ncbi:MAG: hypothetical protein WEB00_05985 [Dehalococcoidia bacterium]
MSDAEKEDEELSDEALEALEQGRRDIRAGRVVSHAEVKRILGL